MTYQDDMIRRLQGGIPTKTGNTGVTGGMLAGAGGLQSPGERFEEPAPSIQAAPPAAPPSGVGNYLGAGFNHDRIRSGELRPTGVQSYKDTFGRVSSNFDPSKGVTPELLAALNAEGLAEFYNAGGKGDRLGYRNVTDKGRQAEMLDPTFEGDFVGNLGGANPSWQFDWNDSAGSAAQKPRGGAIGGGMGIGGGLNSLLAGDPSSGIQAALQQYSGQGDYLKQLLAQLGGAR